MGKPVKCDTCNSQYWDGCSRIPCPKRKPVTARIVVVSTPGGGDNWVRDRFCKDLPREQPLNFEDEE